MFKKSEESEWTRFSRALGGASPAPPRQEEQPSPDEPEEPATVTQLPPAGSDMYMAPAPAPEEHESAAPAVTPPPPAIVTQAPPAQPRYAAATDGETVIGEGATIDGTVRSERPIRVRGAVQGEIECRQLVTIDEEARVQARITAEQVLVLGEVNGSIACSGKVEIAATARVTGDVTAGTLVIQEGAFFEGSLKMANGRDGG
jgi:cytoskeletal protein CcmA (bactofilin family)